MTQIRACTGSTKIALQVIGANRTSSSPQAADASRYGTPRPPTKMNNDATTVANGATSATIKACWPAAMLTMKGRAFFRAPASSEPSGNSSSNSAPLLYTCRSVDSCFSN